GGGGGRGGGGGARGQGLRGGAGIGWRVPRKWPAPAGASVKRNLSPGVAAATLSRTASAGAMTSGPMPSPGRTAIWKLSLASMRCFRVPVHQERCGILPQRVPQAPPLSGVHADEIERTIEGGHDTNVDHREACYVMVAAVVFDSSCPGLTRASIFFAKAFCEDGWIAGSCPAMTAAGSVPMAIAIRSRLRGRPSCLASPLIWPIFSPS